MSSSEDDDMPLSALSNGNGKRSRPEDDDSSEAEFDDTEADETAQEDDINDFIVEEEDDDDDDDDDDDYDSDDSDDIPLSALKSPPKKKAKKPAATSKANATKSNKTAPKKKATTAKKKKSAAPKKAASKPAAGSSAYVSASTELYANCDKGRLIMSLLARWWYVYTWPEPSTLPSSTPAGYDALDGFPGVYICTSGDNVGKFKDCRDHSKSPSFRNLAKKTATELKDDLLKAIEKQRAALIKLEGTGTKTEKDLRGLEKWASNLSCSKVDKDAAKVLKAAKLTV